MAQIKDKYIIRTMGLKSITSQKEGSREASETRKEKFAFCAYIAYIA
jgi:hypothetical protein